MGTRLWYATLRPNGFPPATPPRVKRSALVPGPTFALSAGYRRLVFPPPPRMGPFTGRTGHPSLKSGAVPWQNILMRPIMLALAA